MNTRQAEQRGNARKTETHGEPSQADEQRRRKFLEQRDRKSRDGVIGRRLGVIESSLDFTKFAYRWINDMPSRIRAKTEEDVWDIVHQGGSEVKKESDLGSAVSQVVGTNADGSPLRAYLCRKRLAWYNEDQDEKKRELASQLTELRRGNDRSGASQSDYIPNEGIRI